MIVSINQPAYLPWLGYFHRIAISDLHIVLDNVQFEKNGFTNRNKIRTAQGWSWLTVPVRTKGRFGNLPINELEIDPVARWHEKHWATLKQSYGKTPYFSAYNVFFQRLYATSWKSLDKLIREITHHVLSDGLQIKTPLVYSSEMKVAGQKSDLILNLCKEAGATIYLSGALGRGYLDEKAFTDAGIEIRYHDYKHPVYSQAYDGFEPYMSIVDLLFNHGSESFSILDGAGANLSEV